MKRTHSIGGAMVASLIVAQALAQPDSSNPTTLQRERLLVVSSSLQGVVSKLNVKNGDVVKKGQILAVLDDRFAAIDAKIAKANLNIAKAKQTSAKAGLELAEENLVRLMKLRNQNLIPPAKIVDAKLEIVKAQEAVATSASNIDVALLELARAELKLQMHTLRAPTSGVVVRVLKMPGEAIGKLGTLVLIRPKSDK